MSSLFCKTLIDILEVTFLLFSSLSLPAQRQSHSFDDIEIQLDSFLLFFENVI